MVDYLAWRGGPELPGQCRELPLSTTGGALPAEESAPWIANRRRLLGHLDELVEHTRVIHKGAHLFRLNDPLRHLQLIRSGCCKHYVVDSRGGEHVTGFSFSGDLLGLEALYCGYYHQNARALDTLGLALVPVERLARYACEFPRFGQLLLAALSQKLDQQLAVSFHCQAKQRVAQFLLLLKQKQQHYGPSDLSLTLAMTREDIANYLCLRSETVSRVFSQFVKSGWIRVQRHQIELRDLPALSLAAGMEHPVSPPAASGMQRLAANACGGHSPVAGRASGEFTEHQP